MRIITQVPHPQVPRFSMKPTFRIMKVRERHVQVSLP